MNNRLKAAYEKLLAMEFPPHSESDDMEEILMDLLDVDRCLAGQAQAVLAGERIAPSDIPSTGEMIRAIGAFKAESSAEQTIADKVREYLDGLTAVELALKSSVR